MLQWISTKPLHFSERNQTECKPPRSSALNKDENKRLKKDHNKQFELAGQGHLMVLETYMASCACVTVMRACVRACTCVCVLDSVCNTNCYLCSMSHYIILTLCNIIFSMCKTCYIFMHFNVAFLQYEMLSFTIEDICKMLHVICCEYKSLCFRTRRTPRVVDTRLSG